jgi:hypothetical protein
MWPAEAIASEASDAVIVAIGAELLTPTDHSSLAVTTTYLRRLEGQEDLGWGKVAEAIGV